MKNGKILSAIGAVVAGALLVAGCGPGDHARPLNYKKGVYLGKPDAPLDERTLEELRARTAYQAGLTTLAGTGTAEQTGARTQSADVRPPAAPGTIDMDALRQRAAHQRQ
jgi:hypothetical protein